MIATLVVVHCISIVWSTAILGNEASRATADRRVYARLALASLVVGFAAPVAYGTWWACRQAWRGSVHTLHWIGWLAMVAFERKPKEPEFPKARVVE